MTGSLVEGLSADLTPESYLPRLRTNRIGRAYEPRVTCGSTNDLAARRAHEGAPDGLLVVADSQTGGRGRLGRSWYSPPRENLTFSLLLRPGCSAPELPPLTLLTGLVLAKVLATLGLAPRLKWPNDVLLEEGAGARKLVGILTEMATERERIKHLVIGVGVNVNATDFPPELAARATSLRSAAGRRFDRGLLLADIVNAFEPAYDDALRLGTDSFLPSWRRFAALPRPCRIERPTGSLEGTAVDVDREGALLVQDAAGTTHRIFSGELVSG